MIHTKNFFLNESTIYSRSEPQFSDLGYSLDIPANDITTAGWQYTKPETWGKENMLITRPDPEYFAPENERMYYHKLIPMIPCIILIEANIHTNYFDFFLAYWSDCS